MNKHTHIRFDWAIKKLLRSKANFGILEGFLSELLGKDITIQDIIESESNRETEIDKSNRVDINVKDTNGELFIVEIQNTRELDYFYKILYNSAKAIAENIYKGMTYRSARKVITISILYFDLGVGDDYIYHGFTSFYGIHSKTELQLSETQKRLFKRSAVSGIFPDHYIIRVNNFNDLARDTLDEWIYFLKNSEIKDEFHAKGMSEAREKLKEISMSPAELYSYNRYLENLSTELGIAETIKVEEQYALEKGIAEGLAKGLAEGIEKGIAEGIEKGRQEGLTEGIEKGRQEGLTEGIEKGRQEGHEQGINEGELKKSYEIAREMKTNGFTVEVIAKLTGLDPTTLTSL